MGEEIPRNQETKSVSSKCFTQAALIESYKPQKPVQKPEQVPDDAAVRQMLLAALGKPAYNTWLSACRIVFSGNGAMMILAPSAFSRNLLAKRYGKAIKRVLTTLTGQEIDLQIRVDENLEPVKTVPAPDREPPTPDTPVKSGNSLPTDERPALLLEQHGDIMGVIDHSPLFRKVIAPTEEGGWGIYPQALTKGITCGIRLFRQLIKKEAPNGCAGNAY